MYFNIITCISQDFQNYDIFETNDKAFLVLRKNTMEVRTDSKLKDLLIEKYESVMESRYFGRGGIEIVPAGQLSTEEIADLIRLSYNITEWEESVITVLKHFEIAR